MKSFSPLFGEDAEEEYKPPFADPLHAHSFQRLSLRTLTAIERSMLFFRDCQVCRQRLLTLGRNTLPTKSSRASSDASDDDSLTSKSSNSFSQKAQLIKRQISDICQCLSCLKYVHRDCLSRVHRHRHCRHPLTDLIAPCQPSKPLGSNVNAGRQRYSPVVPSARRQSGSHDVRSDAPKLFGNEELASEGFTLSTLVEELSQDQMTTGTPPQEQKVKAGSRRRRMMKKAAPFLAAGGVLGALALGPAGGMIAGINMMLAGVTTEAMAAGVGLTAATVATATITRQKRLRAAKQSLEKMKSGAWAMEICWHVKQKYSGDPSDALFQKDAEFTKRIQQWEYKHDHANVQLPTEEEVYDFLYIVFSSREEVLAQMNGKLLDAFHERQEERRQKARGESISKGTLQDAKMYVAHIASATYEYFPSLTISDMMMVLSSRAIERIVYDDIYRDVFQEFEGAFGDADDLFHGNLQRLREELDNRPSLLVKNGELHEDLAVAEQLLVEMMNVTRAPLMKLKKLHDAFVRLCEFADRLHQTASSADILIPILCSLLATSKRFAPLSSKYGGTERNFVSEIAFVSFFTNGGGHGVEGYVLTSFQAAIQVIAAVDLSAGPAHELELYMQEELMEKDGEDEFHDAFTGAEEQIRQS